jgi:hypothetical protein
MRGIQYAQASRTLLNRINDALTLERQPPLVPWTISRIGGFYLPSNLNVEDEVRLMMKRHKGGTDVTRSDGQYDYWPVPIGVRNPVCMIEVTGIECGPNADRAAVMPPGFRRMLTPANSVATGSSRTVTSRAQPPVKSRLRAVANENLRLGIVPESV